MGKFSEALKKAGKEDRLKPLAQEDERLSPEKTNAVPANKKLTRHSSPVIRGDESVPRIDNTAASMGRPSMVERAVPILQADPPSIPDDEDVDQITVKRQDDDRPADQTHNKLEFNDTNGVLGKTPKPEIGTLPDPPVKARKHKNLNGSTRASRREIQINYSKTKVQAVDFEKLKNNKIFSIFDDIETTDQIKILRTKVLKKLNAVGGNSILITSSNPYEGKTFTSINLGVSIAKEFDRTVLIIDADLRKPTKRHTAFSTGFFSLDVNVGLTDYLKGEADIPDILINPGIKKLTLIPSGKPIENAPELLNSIRMEEMMLEIKSRYASDRLVIVDGPAMLPFPDAAILSRYVDGVVVVIEAERTSNDDLKKMSLLLKEVNLLGTVFNKNRV